MLNARKYKSILIRSVVYISLFFVFLLLYNYLLEVYSNKSDVIINIVQETQTEYQIFYVSEKGNIDFNEQYSVKTISDQNSKLQRIKASVGMDGIVKISHPNIFTSFKCVHSNALKLRGINSSWTKHCEPRIICFYSHMFQ